jgi:hypothetical protein
MKQKMTVGDWLELRPDLQDALAGVALYRQLGDQTSALRLLGFDGDGRQFAKTKALVFGTPGVACIVRAACLAEVDEAKHEAVPRLYRSVRYGDDDTATRAAEILTRLLSWPVPAHAEPAQATPSAPTLLAAFSHEPEPDPHAKPDLMDVEPGQGSEVAPSPFGPDAERTVSESFQAAFAELAGDA